MNAIEQKSFFVAIYLLTLSQLNIESMQTMSRITVAISIVIYIFACLWNFEDKK